MVSKIIFLIIVSNLLIVSWALSSTSKDLLNSVLYGSDWTPLVVNSLDTLITTNPIINILAIFGIRVLILLSMCFYTILIGVYVALTHHRYNASIKDQFLALLRNPLRLPQMDACVESGIRMYSSFNMRPYESKYTWYSMFQKAGVPTPECIGTVIDGVQTLVVPINRNKEYILKPIRGGFGRGILPYTPSNLPKNRKYVIQERVHPKGYSGVLRVVTVRPCKGWPKVFSRWLILQSSTEDKISINHAQGDEAYELQGTRIRNTRIGGWREMPQLSEPILETVYQTAIKLHSELPEAIEQVGWDILVDAESYTFLEGNAPGAVVFAENCDYYEIAQKFSDELECREPRRA
jgi:hypothetical protein